MPLNNNKLDKLAAILTFVSVLLIYFLFTVILLLIVAAICWLFHFNFKIVGKVIYILWTILFLYIVWNDWDDYYVYSKKVVKKDFGDLLEEKNTKVIKEVEVTKSNSKQEDTFIFFGIYTNKKIFQKSYPSQTSEYYAWIVKYPLTFVKRIKETQLLKLLKINFKYGYEFKWIENSKIFQLFIIEINNSSNRYIVISSCTNKNKLYLKLIYALYLIKEIKRIKLIKKLQKINIKT